jgi:hypothetical protein
MLSAGVRTGDFVEPGTVDKVEVGFHELDLEAYDGKMGPLRLSIHSL